jgi:stress response protein SCP2
VVEALPKGANAPLSGGRVAVRISAAGGLRPDVSALLLTEHGKVRSDDDFAFYNQPAVAGGAVRWAEQEITADLGALPAEIEKVVVAATVDRGTFAGVPGLSAEVLADGTAAARAELTGFTSETGIVAVELYRRAGAWKVRHVGQGYDNGLAGIATDFGVSVDDAAAPAAAAAPSDVSPRAAAAAASWRNPGGHRPAKTVSFVKDGAGRSAVDLSKVPAVDLRKKAEAAGVSLQKRGLAGMRAQAVLVLDHSGSMRRRYDSGEVQELVERVLGFVLQIDVDGTVPVIPFDSRVKPTVEVTLDNYRDVVNREIYQKRRMGTTDLAAALREVQLIVEPSDSPVFCVIVTDGAPNSRRDTTKLVVELARYPVFLKFLALEYVDYLQELDDLPDSKRLLDNVDFKDIPDVRRMSPEEFADAMTDEWDTWVGRAGAAGVLA